MNAIWQTFPDTALYKFIPEVHILLIFMSDDDYLDTW